MQPMKRLLRTAAAALLAASALIASAADRDIMAWGTAATDEAAPFVTSLRIGCTMEPSACIASYKPAPGIKYITIPFGQADKPDLVMQRASIYSKLSLEHAVLKEVSIDDAWSFMRRANVPDKGKYINDLIDAVKSANPKLQFGVTFYEDEIDQVKKNSANLPADARAKVDRVALYLHFRSNWEKYPEYVSETKKLFPNAVIYGGVYHYDRIDYLKCKQGGKDKCSKNDEFRLYQDALNLQLGLLKSKAIGGLELYPGFLGAEDKWWGWSDSAMCDQRRKSECIENSKIMSNDTVRALR
ncbi:hypothetical protein APR50_10425 [Variovorax paradoxus]|jgi:hypothetical protein|nr:hypothetical protein APR52_20675 [Variovorax paradoxus]KPV08878.1 hypothetical protein APR50_10425 [Variovorax paradoxus]KPV11375.1 hypothetical protein APR49_09300 [Variovorax paradoxus]KPV31167.1 hypothetical protein APR48_17730 [Variovorax paradoxus]KPV33260.1 hypothetical protein APR47_18115 [Variovorax paradoxus]